MQKILTFLLVGQLVMETSYSTDLRWSLTQKLERQSWPMSLTNQRLRQSSLADYLAFSHKIFSLLCFCNIPDWLACMVSIFQLTSTVCPGQESVINHFLQLLYLSNSQYTTETLKSTCVIHKLHYIGSKKLLSVVQNDCKMPSKRLNFDVEQFLMMLLQFLF